MHGDCHGRGVGPWHRRGACLRLAADGWAVAALDRDGEAVQETARLAASGNGGAAVGLTCDVTEAGSVDAAVAAVERDLPPVAALVNNAGITAPTRFLDIDVDEWDRIFDVNVRGTYLVTRRVVPGLLARGHGRIVNLSSVSAQRGGGLFGGSDYAAAKAAVLGLIPPSPAARGGGPLEVAHRGARGSESASGSPGTASAASRKCWATTAARSSCWSRAFICFRHREVQRLAVAPRQPGVGDLPDHRLHEAVLP